jgi:hypothetical protein
MSADVNHPAPHRHRVGPRLLLAGLTAGPAAWILQLVVAYGLSSFACAPRGMPRSGGASNWPGHPFLLGLNIACLALAAFGGAIALRSWRQTGQEKFGGGHVLLETGEGRTRFLAACGVLSALGFITAILFNTVEFFTVPACWGRVS